MLARPGARALMPGFLAQARLIGVDLFGGLAVRLLDLKVHVYDQRQDFYTELTVSEASDDSEQCAAVALNSVSPVRLCDTQAFKFVQQ